MYSIAHLEKFVETYSAKVLPDRQEGSAGSKRMFYCEPDEFAFYVKHLNSLTVKDKKGKPLKRAMGWMDSECWKRPLTVKEAQFIVDSQNLCRNSWYYYATRVHTIRDVRYESQRKVFELNTAQKIAHSLISQFGDKALPIYLQALKARQLGITTFSISVMVWLGLFTNNKIIGIASSSEDKSDKLRDDHILAAINQVPWWLYDYANTQIHESGGEVLRNDATVKNVINLYHGQMKTDAGRGDSSTNGHFTELIEWNDMNETLFNGFLHAVHPNPSTFIILESTARGKNNEWHKLWMDNVKNYPNQRSYICPFFLPWFVGSDIYPTPSWLKLVPVPSNYIPADHVQRHAAKARDYVIQSSLLREQLGLDWHMPIEQMWYYEYKHDEALRKENLAGFFSEMPADPDDAFQNKQGGVFSRDTIELMRAGQGLPIAPPLMFKEFGVPAQLDPPAELTITESSARDEREANLVSKWSKQLKYSHLAIGVNYSWNLVPTRARQLDSGMRWFDCEPDGVLWIWEEFNPTDRYFVSLDAGHGVGRDNTVIQVGKLAKGVKGPAQVAEFASNRISASESFYIYLCLLCMYSAVPKQDNAQGYGRNFALAVPEVQANGMEVVNRLINLGWPNIYERRVFGAIGRVSVNRNQYGWETTPKTRRIIIDWVLRLIRGNQTLIRSPWMIDELDGLVKLEDNAQREIDHQKGGHDDRIFAYFIGVIAAHWDMVEGLSQPGWVAPQSDVLSKMAKDRQKEISRLPSWFYHSLYYDAPAEAINRIGAMQNPNTLPTNLIWQSNNQMTNSGNAPMGKIPYGAISNPLREGGANHSNLSNMLDSGQLGVYTLTEPMQSATLDEKIAKTKLEKQIENGKKGLVANLVSLGQELEEKLNEEIKVKFNQGAPRLRGKR